MKNHEYLVALSLLLTAFGGANFMLGRAYWRREKLAKWIISLVSTIIVVAAGVKTLLVYLPELSEHLTSPTNFVILLFALMGLSKLYRYCFALGDRTAYRRPDPNQPYEVNDIPPMPTNMTPASK